MPLSPGCRTEAPPSEASTTSPIVSPSDISGAVRAGRTLMPDPAALNRLKLFWISVGNRDALFRFAHGVHSYATEKGVPHIWRVDTNAHDTASMSSSFYHFAQKLFKQ